MESIPASKFKATCLALLEKVKTTGQPILVTRRGVAMAKLVPPDPPRPPRSWLGSMQGSARVLGDVVAPATDPADWESSRG
jgi:prevent-host-death family protein